MSTRMVVTTAIVVVVMALLTIPLMLSRPAVTHGKFKSFESRNCGIGEIVLFEEFESSFGSSKVYPEHRFAENGEMGCGGPLMGITSTNSALVGMVSYEGKDFVHKELTAFYVWNNSSGDKIIAEFFVNEESEPTVCFGFQWVPSVGTSDN